MAVLFTFGSSFDAHKEVKLFSVKILSNFTDILTRLFISACNAPTYVHLLNNVSNWIFCNGAIVFVMIVTFDRHVEIENELFFAYFPPSILRKLQLDAADVYVVFLSFSIFFAAVCCNSKV